MVLASFFCNFFIDGVGFSYGNFITVLEHDLNSTLTEISAIPSIMIGFYFMFGPVFSALVNRFGFRIVAFAGGILAATGKYYCISIDILENDCWKFKQATLVRLS